MPKKANKSPPAGNQKPKRPLSGYNLFYRFKRNAILEASTNNATHHQQHYPPLSEEEERTQIDQILKATPGLEGIPLNHVVFTYTPTSLQEFRSQQIRSAMEGKLFPNENARNRLHRKVHGMGFVEMGRIMRDMWAGIDGFTKDIFCELADVGRVRYRTLLAEYKKLQDEGDAVAADHGGAPSAAAGKGGKKAKQARSSAENKVESASSAEKAKANNRPSRAEAVEQVKSMYKPKASSTLSSSTSSSGAHASSSATVDMIVDPIVEVETPKVEVKPTVTMSFITPVPSQANLARFGTTRSNNTNVSSSNDFGVPTPSVFQETGTFSVPTMPTRHAAAPVQEPRYGRRVSTASELSVNSSSNIASLGMVNSTSGAGSITPSFTELNSSMTNSSMTRAAYQEVNMFRSLLLQNAMLPPPLYHPQMMNNATSTTTMAPSSSSSTSIINDEYSMSVFPPEIITSSSSSCDAAAPKEEIPPQDFLDFIGKLDDALDTNDSGSSHGCASNDDDTMMCNHAVKRPSMIFGKPIHDVNNSSLYPLPSDYELNNARARMA